MYETCLNILRFRERCIIISKNCFTAYSLPLANLTYMYVLYGVLKRRIGKGNWSALNSFMHIYDRDAVRWYDLRRASKFAFSVSYSVCWDFSNFRTEHMVCFRIPSSQSANGRFAKSGYLCSSLIFLMMNFKLY